MEDSPFQVSDDFISPYNTNKRRAHLNYNHFFLFEVNNTVKQLILACRKL